MKTFLILLASIFLSLSLQAQTELSATNAAPATNLISATNSISADALSSPTNSIASTNRIEIFSDSAEFLIETNIAVYTGNVRATYGETKLNCDVLTLHVPKGGERPDYMVADRNVIIDTKDKSGKPVHATGDQGVYTYKVENGATNEIMVLSGDAFIRTGDGSSLHADPIIWNLGKGTINVASPHMIINQVPKEISTNKPASTLSHTNQP